jgi:hypothetical protein
VWLRCKDWQGRTVSGNRGPGDASWGKRGVETRSQYPRAIVAVGGTRALSALERFELDDPSFHPYTSKYDGFLEGDIDDVIAFLKTLSDADAQPAVGH